MADGGSGRRIPWRWLGLAGLAGVAATGAVLARDERRRRAYTPDDVRARLQERLAAADTDPGDRVARPAANVSASPRRPPSRRP